ncbi:DUF4399 domain-containing protein [sulfur-oxidizing endosymbiont of Gigantopelta aegis]|uniref:DUF4399 domain-containing protein n=1 Tax=sulfur-oxidizing endosymbiont of Gigantopelta aegis TaxID=2794934 RepID=UPI0018DB762A|nr:DUF4399 domain-containing protein [sulfur-oxidizing endosymbiont of Gigantopelta aegis]
MTLNLTGITFYIVLLNIVIFSADISAHGIPVPMNASTSINSPADGDTVSSPFLVKFSVRNFMIAPSGENVNRAGHYHLLINVIEPVNYHESLPFDQQHLDFEQGESEVLLKLPKGKHRLQLVVGDQTHEPIKPLVSNPITITVK